MNLNPKILTKKRPQSFFPGPAATMGPPATAPAKSRKHKAASSVSSSTNWGKSVINTSLLRSSTTVSEESRVILALSEGRGEARGEVGLASIDLSLPTLMLCQISDTQSYINTLTKINVLNPTDIIVPSTFLETENRLVKKIKEKFPSVKVLGFPRKNFNKATGLDRILQLCLPSANAICVGIQHKYYALASASGLTAYLQNNLNIYYAKQSVNVFYQESEGYAVIDVATADRLELVSCTKPAQQSRYSTLFGVLNCCVTKAGARLLRSTILQPPCQPSIIEKNLQCVHELIKHPEALLTIQTVLQKISHVDQLLSLASMTLGTTDGCSVRQLNYLLFLNGLFDVVELLKEVIKPLQQEFFQRLCLTLESDNFQKISEKIRTTIHPSARLGNGRDAGTTQRCFAIKSDINGLLDLLRKTYSERLNELNQYVKKLSDSYNLPLTLGNNNTKGYHMVLKLTKQQKRTFKVSDLPAEFTQVCRLAASCTMKTDELVNLSTRIEDMMMEIIKISNVMIYQLIVDLKQYLGFFHKLCEDVARLDLFQSLAEASRRRNYVRPKFGDFTELTNSRHPMLELLIGQSVANPISICSDFNVQIITGPNGSGKSIYIRQLMLLQIMAQVGCYIPADSAIFKPVSRMFARIYLEDDMEYGASTFVLEMREVKYMMSLLNEDCLFIVDELCRSTAATEGAALAMAICEKFCHTSAFLLVTTHYTSLANLRNMYLNVKTWQMETIATGDRPQELSLDFRYKLIPGVTNLKHYGVYIVKKIWPQSMLNDVYRLLEVIANRPEDTEYETVNEATRIKYKLESDFRKLKSLHKLSRPTINRLLNECQNEFRKLGISVDCAQSKTFKRQIRVNESNDENEESYTQQIEHALDLETSSYRNLSNFLREDSNNVNMLIPDVSIASSERPICISAEETSNLSSTEWVGNVQNLTNEEKQILEDSIQCFLEDEASETCLKQNKVQNTANEKKTDSENSSLEDENFAFSQEDEVEYEGARQHIYPEVKIIQGPDWPSGSSQDSQENYRSFPSDFEQNTQVKHFKPESTQESWYSADQSSQLLQSQSWHSPERASHCSQQTESVSYSPLCSQSSFYETNANQATSTSSSLHFLANAAPSSDTNSSAQPKRISSSDTNSSLKPENITMNSQRSFQKTVRRRFVPPKKLTRKEIEEEFAEQDRKFYQLDVSNESDLSKLLQQKLNRPSVRQVQNSKQLAVARRTDDGVVVIPAQPEKQTTFRFKRHLSTNNSIDMSIFSDKNAQSFDNFINSEERDVKKFKFDFQSQEFNFQPQSISEYAAHLEKSAPKEFLTPDGFYKQNKSDIKSIIKKYLGESSGEMSTSKRNMFETSLHDDDIDF